MHRPRCRCFTRNNGASEYTLALDAGTGQSPLPACRAPMASSNISNCPSLPVGHDVLSAGWQAAQLRARHGRNESYLLSSLGHPTAAAEGGGLEGVLSLSTSAHKELGLDVEDAKLSVQQVCTCCLSSGELNWSLHCSAAHCAAPPPGHRWPRWGVGSPS